MSLLSGDTVTISRYVLCHLSFVPCFHLVLGHSQDAIRIDRRGYPFPAFSAMTCYRCKNTRIYPILYMKQYLTPNKTRPLLLHNTRAHLPGSLITHPEKVAAHASQLAGEAVTGVCHTWTCSATRYAGSLAAVGEEVGSVS